MVRGNGAAAKLLTFSTLKLHLKFGSTVMETVSLLPGISSKFGRMATQPLPTIAADNLAVLGWSRTSAEAVT
jgi:hypothetical protein